MSAGLTTQGGHPSAMAALRTIAAQPWREGAACAGLDPELWTLPHNDSAFSIPEQEARNGDAVRVCRRCPVQQQCLLDGYADGLPGVIRGGESMDGSRQVGTCPACMHPLITRLTAGRDRNRYCDRDECVLQRRRDAAAAVSS